MKNKIKYIMISAIACLSVLNGCTEVDDTARNDESLSENTVTYNGITNPVGEPKAHRVTTAAKTTTVTTAATTPEAAQTTITAATVTQVTETTTTAATTTQTTVAPDSNVDSSEILFTIANQNSWKQDNQTVYQYELSITNNSASAISAWTVEIPVSDTSAELLQGWSAEYTLSTGSLIITPVDFNTTIEAGALASFGFQLASTGSVDISDAVLNINGYSVNLIS